MIHGQENIKLMHRLISITNLMHS